MEQEKATITPLNIKSFTASDAARHMGQVMREEEDVQIRYQPKQVILPLPAREPTRAHRELTSGFQTSQAIGRIAGEKTTIISKFLVSSEEYLEFRRMKKMQLAKAKHRQIIKKERTTIPYEVLFQE